VITDNLATDQSTQLRLRDDKKKGIVVDGCNIVEVFDIQHALQVYYEST